MTEDEAKEWLLDRFGTAKLGILERFAAMLVVEAGRQNLIAPSTIATIWSRHLLDSAQLMPLVAGHNGRWIDIGSGAGLPGIVAAILGVQQTILVEPRKRRVEFLEQCVTDLSLTNANVRCNRIEAIKDHADILSARAVGGIEQLFVAAASCSSPATIWLLPRGSSGALELAQAQKSWHGTFHVEQSLTHPDSRIVVAQGVKRR